MNVIQNLFNAYKESHSGLKKECWQGILVYFLNSLFSGICFYLSLYFVNNLKYSALQASIAISCYGIGNIFGGIFFGRLADSYSPYYLSIVCLIIQAVCFIALIYVNVFTTLACLLISLGVVTYGFTTTNTLWVLSKCNENNELKLKALNIIYMSSNLGLGASALLIGFGAHFGFNKIFLYSAFIFVLIALYIYVFQKNQTDLNYSFTQEQTCLDVKPKGKLILTLVLSCLFLVGIVVAQRRSTYPIYLDHLFNTGTRTLGIILALNPILIVICQTTFIHLLRNKNKILVVGVGAFFIGLSMTLLNFSNNFYFICFACIVYTIGEMMFFAMAQLICYENGMKKNKGMNLGLYKTIYASSIVLGPTIGGYFFNYNESFLWNICGALGLMCLIFCFLYNYSNKKKLDQKNWQITESV